MPITIERRSLESVIAISFEPVPGNIDISTDSGFLDHMLRLLANNAGWTVSLKASGDSAVDHHHLVEDRRTCTRIGARDYDLVKRDVGKDLFRDLDVGQDA